MKPKLIIFASGTANGGGSGFENLVGATKSGVLDAEIVAVVSNHEHGGVRERANRLGIPFFYFQSGMSYPEVVRKTGAEWVALSGWLKKVSGLDPTKTFNIHPALLSQLNGRFGGPGMYGHRVHEAVADALERGEISESGLTMHFVTDQYDRGPAFFEYKVSIEKGLSAEDIGKRVQAAEHEWQPKLTNLVVHGDIRWDGKDPKTLVVPDGYQYLPKL